MMRSIIRAARCLIRLLAYRQKWQYKQAVYSSMLSVQAWSSISISLKFTVNIEMGRKRRGSEICQRSQKSLQAAFGKGWEARGDDALCCVLRISILKYKLLELEWRTASLLACLKHSPAPELLQIKEIKQHSPNISSLSKLCLKWGVTEVGARAGPSIK